MSDEPFTIIRDTREKDNRGWYFDNEVYAASIVERGLKTADYTIEGFEDTICIERKATVSEFARNIVASNFKNEIKRMSEFPHAFLILEFSWRSIQTYPVGSTVPKHRWKDIKITPKLIMKWINVYRISYGIHVIACNNRIDAEKTAYDLLKILYENKTKFR